jgi:hypothetical protein
LELVGIFRTELALSQTKFAGTTVVIIHRFGQELP